MSEAITEEKSVDENREDIKWMLLPNGRGDPQLAILSGLDRSNAPDLPEPLVESIKFYLYTRYFI